VRLPFDAVVVGAGSAGCVLAARLSADPARRVLLIEAGPDYPDPAALPADLRDARLPTYSHDWGYCADEAALGRRIGQPRGRVMGGCSATNAAVALRGQASDYDAWVAAGNPGWSADQVLPFFKRLETDLDFTSAAHHGADGPIAIQRTPVPELTDFNAAALEAAVCAGHEYVPDHNLFGAAGAGTVPLSRIGHERQSTAVTYLLGARSRPNLTVLPETLVEAVVVRRSRACGVRLADGEEILAGSVILAAGVFGSPAVLLRSGIGPPRELRRHRIPVVAAVPGVGMNLTDHPRISSEWPASPESAARHQYQVLITSARNDAGTDFQHFAGYAGRPSTPGGRGPVFWLCASLMKPLSRGQVSLRSAKPDEPPRIELGLLREAADLDRLLAGLETARRICAAPPLRSLLRGPELLGTRASGGTAALRAAVREEVRSAYHQVGTCSMGPDPQAGAVVDARCRVHLVDRLWVADASVMPEIPSANTNLPTIMVAERAHAWLADEA